MSKRREEHRKHKQSTNTRRHSDNEDDSRNSEAGNTIGSFGNRQRNNSGTFTTILGRPSQHRSSNSTENRQQRIKSGLSTANVGRPSQHRPSNSTENRQQRNKSGLSTANVGRPSQHRPSNSTENRQQRNKSGLSTANLGRPSQHRPSNSTENRQQRNKSGLSTVNLGRPSQHRPSNSTENRQQRNKSGLSTANLRRPSQHRPSNSTENRQQRNKSGLSTVNLGQPSQHRPSNSTENRQQRNKSGLSTANLRRPSQHRPSNSTENRQQRNKSGLSTVNLGQPSQHRPSNSTENRQQRNKSGLSTANLGRPSQHRPSNSTENRQQRIKSGLSTANVGRPSQHRPSNSTENRQQRNKSGLSTANLGQPSQHRPSNSTENRQQRNNSGTFTVNLGQPSQHRPSNSTENRQQRNKSGLSTANLGRPSQHRPSNSTEYRQQRHNSSSSTANVRRPSQRLSNSRNQARGNETGSRQNTKQSSSSNSRKRASSASTSTSEPKKKKKRNPFFYFDDRLERLNAKDPSVIILELLKDREEFSEFLKSDEIKPKAVEEILEILSKLYETPHTLNFAELLAVFKGTAFVTKHLRRYIMQLPVRMFQEERLLDKRVHLQRIIQYFQEFLNRFPDSYEELPLDGLFTYVSRLQDSNNNDKNSGSHSNNNSSSIANSSSSNNDSSNIRCESERNEIINDIEKLLSHRDCIIQEKATSTTTLSLAGTPPDDYRNIPIFPRREDIFPSTPPFLRKNIVRGRYNNTSHYLDVQFRLLREDYIAPLREGVQEVIGTDERQSRSIHVYRNVRVIDRSLDSKSGGYLYRLSFDVSRMGRVKWEHSKRFKYGSLYCLIESKTQTTIHFVTIAERKIEDLRRGHIIVKFFVDELLDTAFVQQRFFMIESPAYFESYRYVLEGLQQLNEKKLPFQRYLVECNPDVLPPAYLQSLRKSPSLSDGSEDVSISSVQVPPGCYELKAALGCKDADIANSVSILDFSTWPSLSQVDLNASQLNAVKAALTQEFVVIQGPPGTGKTFVGLRITQALLANKESWYRNRSYEEVAYSRTSPSYSRTSPIYSPTSPSAQKSKQHGTLQTKTPAPILVVCYTNHALDQFLEGILKFTENIVRVGSRSKNESLARFNLKQKKRLSKQFPLKYRLTSDLKECKENIETEQLAIKMATSGTLSDDEVLSILNNDESEQLQEWKHSACYSKMSVIEAWLKMNDLYEPNERNKTCGKKRKRSSRKSHDSGDKAACTATRNCHAHDVDYTTNYQDTSIKRFQSSEKVCAVQTSSNFPTDTENEFRGCNRSAASYLEDGEIKDESRRSVQETKNQTIMMTTVERSPCQTNPSQEGNDIAEASKNLRLISVEKRECVLDGLEEEKLINSGDDMFSDHNKNDKEETDEKGVLDSLEEGELIDSESEVFSYHNKRDDEERTDKDETMQESANDLTETEDEATVVVTVAGNSSPFAQKRRIVCITEKKVVSEEGEVQIDSESDIFSHDQLDDGETMDEEEEEEIKRQGPVIDLSLTMAAETPDKSPQRSDGGTNQVDLKRLCAAQRFDLYKAWVHRYKEFHRDEFKRYSDMHDHLSKRISEVENIQTEGVLKDVEVIGMTTTGAARHRHALQAIKPRIVIVEEAAEVLEGHVVTALSSSTDHLILIGDHKQLKPNPTVYELARKYNLEISLFERMVINGLTCHSLDTQHRMRPQIADIMRIIYPKLIDDYSVRSHDRIQGIRENVYFIDHSVPESTEEELKSHSNDHEASFVAALCKYLLQQGYEAPMITVLTMYTGQLLKLKGLMPKDSFEGVRICSVDNFQGEESDIIILSLVRSNKNGNIGFLNVPNRVCVALSRAKMGLYCIGNISMMAEKNILWRTIKTHLEEKSAIGSSLPLCCPNHQDKITQASYAYDFNKAPQGGCLSPCEYRYVCGHACPLSCHPKDPKHERVCRKPCLKELCDLKHLCKQQCHLRSCSQCTTLVPKIIPSCKHEIKIECWNSKTKITCPVLCQKDLPCGHRCRGKCGQVCKDVPCLEKLKRTLPCGHEASMECSADVEKHQCQSPCRQLLDCEHRCTGTCHGCRQGTYHVQCAAPCNRVLVCSHECEEPCTKDCPPCRKKCKNRCYHSSCQNRCGSFCTQCREPCMWKCKHYKCNARCGELCDRKRCDSRCPLKLFCGHRCVGLCGEYCPELCRICNKAELQEIFLGREDESGAKYVALVDCGHVFQVDDLDYWMEGMNDEESDSVTIQLKVCPKCKTAIRRNFRYGNIIKKTLADIEAVKKKKLIEQERLTKKRYELRKRFDDMMRDSRRYLSNLQLLEGSRSYWLRDAEEYSTFENQLKLLPCIVEINRKFLQTSDNEKFVERSPQLLDKIKRLTKLLTTRTILTNQEVSDISDRIVVFSLNCRFQYLLWQTEEKVDKAKVTADVKASLEAVKEKLSNAGLTDVERAEIKRAIEDVCRQIGVDALTPTELAAERKEIVKVINLGKGHWFKCPNGHIYAIGECGGAMQKSVCPECQEVIGGGQHKLVEGNELAPEMDGAPHAAWSDHGNLENYDQEELRRLQMF